MSREIGSQRWDVGFEMPDSQGTQWHHNQAVTGVDCDEVSAEARAVGAPLAAALDRCGSNEDSKDRRWTEPILGVPLSYRWTRASSGLLARVTV